MEKELLCIVTTLKSFRKILLGCEIVLFTDNRNICYENPKSDTKVQRMFSLLNEYNVRIKHIEGRKNIAADYLSRNNLCKIAESQNLLSNTTYLYLQQFHEQNGHPGAHSSYNTLRRFEKIPNLYKLLTSISENCHLCQTCKSRDPKKGLSTGIIRTEEPLLHISSDICGPFESQLFQQDFNSNKFFVITFTDRATRYTKLYPTEKITSHDIIKGFNSVWLPENGYPKSILADRAKAYMSTQFTRFCKAHNIKNYNTTCYNPTGNALSERINSRINECLRIYKNADLKHIISIIERRLNYIYNRCLQAAPIELIKQMNPLDKNHAYINTKKVYEVPYIYTNKGRRHHIYKENDRVYLKNYIRKNKTDPYWTGPYTIVAMDSKGNRARVKDNNTITWQNIKNIKPCGRGQDVVHNTT